MIIVRLLSPGPFGWLAPPKFTRVQGADIVMESITLIEDYSNSTMKTSSVLCAALASGMACCASAQSAATASDAPFSIAVVPSESGIADYEDELSLQRTLWSFSSSCVLLDTLFVLATGRGLHKFATA